jgi:hypothetical protein
MPIFQSKLNEEEKEYIAKECHRILERLKNNDPNLCHRAGLCTNSETSESGIRLQNLFLGSYPFNKDWQDYDFESLNGTIFKNKKRMAFLRRWAKKHK